MKTNLLKRRDLFYRWAWYVLNRAYRGYLPSDQLHNYYRAPMPSRWFIVRFFDRMYSKVCFGDTFAAIDLIALWIIIPLGSVILSLFDSDWCFRFSMGGFFFLVADSLVLNRIYRFFRHWYFQSHNLPGPYGDGTLNLDATDSYDVIKRSRPIYRNGRYLEMREIDPYIKKRPRRNR